MDLLLVLILVRYHNGRTRKMKEIRLFLDYKCYPIWIYDENGSLINNDLSEEIKNENDFEFDKKIVILFT